MVYFSSNSNPIKAHFKDSICFVIIQEYLFIRYYFKSLDYYPEFMFKDSSCNGIFINNICNNLNYIHPYFVWGKGIAETKLDMSR